MIDWFTNQPAVVLAAKKYLIWVIVLPLVAVWGFQLDGVFIGATRAGDLRNAMVISFTGFLLFSWLFVPRWGNDGLWLAFCGFMALRGLTLGLRLKVTAHDFMLHQLNESKS
jgi:MATE family multidrug resistance protein